MADEKPPGSNKWADEKEKFSLEQYKSLRDEMHKHQDYTIRMNQLCLIIIGAVLLYGIIKPEHLASIKSPSQNTNQVDLAQVTNTLGTLPSTNKVTLPPKTRFTSEHVPELFLEYRAQVALVCCSLFAGCYCLILISLITHSTRLRIYIHLRYQQYDKTLWDSLLSRYTFEKPETRQFARTLFCTVPCLPLFLIQFLCALTLLSSKGHTLWLEVSIYALFGILFVFLCYQVHMISKKHCPQRELELLTQQFENALKHNNDAVH